MAQRHGAVGCLPQNPFKQRIADFMQLGHWIDRVGGMEKCRGDNHDGDHRRNELPVTFQQAGMIVVLGDQKAKVER